MLDFDTASTGSSKRTRTTQFRHDDGLAALIERAAKSLAVEKSVFLRAAIEKEARRVLDAQLRHVLTPEDTALFAAALDAPPAPTPRALEAARNYRALVAHVD